MDLHILGGFLGSGKTTAIASALKVLLAQGRRIGVITNDKGRHMVDTAFLGMSGVPIAEVPGGCFRCNYGDFQERIAELQREARPDVLFAESVGSCVDLVGPVLTPLTALSLDGGPPRVTYTVFADIRLLRRYLAGLALPFSDNVVYIFAQQLEEAGIVVANKADLVSDEVGRTVMAQLSQRFPKKALLLQTSLTPDGVMPWLELLANPRPLPPALALDYGPYVAGAAELAWFDERLRFTPPSGQARATVVRVLDAILGGLRRENHPLAHLKVAVQDAAGLAKLSFTEPDGADWQAAVPALDGGGPVTLLVNARVQMEPGALQALIAQALADTLGRAGIAFTTTGPTAYAPQVPT